MALNTPKRTVDGFRSLVRGVNAGDAPSDIRRDQIAWGVNTTVRGGRITHRPGFRRIDLSFLAPGGDPSETVQSRFETGRFQGASYFRSGDSGGVEMIVASVSGRLFRIVPGQEVSDDNRVTEITPLKNDGTDDYNNPNNETAWMAQAENHLIVQDGQGTAIIFNGATARRAVAEQLEVPVGTAMAYGNGRLWIAQGTQFVAGDIAGGDTGVLRFTENDYLNEGGKFAVPGSTGNITAIEFQANLDTSLGSGDMIVFTPYAAYAVNVPTDRDQWKNLNIPLQRVALKGYGAEGAGGVAAVNGDLWFRSRDGIRSLIFAQRQFGQWANIPMSREIGRLLDRDDRRLLPFASAVLFDNRLLMTCAPERSIESGVYHKGLAVLDFDLVGGMFEQAPPAYDGIWSGLRVLKLVKGFFKGIERCFAFVLSSGGAIQLWEVTRDGYYDDTGTAKSRIQWSFETMSFPFADGGQELKRLETGEFWIDQAREVTDFQVKFRADQYPLWNTWHSWSVDAPYSQCSFSACTTTLSEYKPQYRTRLGLPKPPQSCAQTDGKPGDHGYEFQFLVKVTGSCRFRMGRFSAHPVQETPLPIVDCTTVNAAADDTGTDGISGSVFITEEGEPMITEDSSQLILAPEE